MDENDSQPIGDPQPIEPRLGRKILKRSAGIVMVVVGGVIAFAQLLAPTRLSGASRSARLLWQQRQKEIRDTIQQERSGTSEMQKPASTKQNGPQTR